MLRVIQAGLTLPISYPVDPNAVFQPGMLCQLKVLGNDIVMGVSDGIAPFGIIDEFKDIAFSKPVVDEVVIIQPNAVTFDGYQYRAAYDTMRDIRHANLVPGTFVSDSPSIISLNETNGIVTIKAGTPLNYATTGSLTPNAFRTKIRYAYYVPNRPGEDTTFGSQRMTLWAFGGIYQTDQFESVPFAVNASLYCSASGRFTTEQTIPNQPSIGMVIVPPVAHNAFLEFKFFG